MGPSADNSTELQLLLDRARGGEVAAYDELVALATGRLHKLAQRMLRGYPRVHRWEETDDVLQAALMRLHRSLSEVRPESTRAFFGLAATQLRRTLIDLSRHYYGVYGQGAKHHTEGGQRAADDDGGPLALAAGMTEKPEEIHQWTAFHEAVEALPDEEREAFSCMWYGGLKQQEMATLLDVSQRTIIRRLQRARQSLHRMLAGEPPPLREGVGE